MVDGCGLFYLERSSNPTLYPTGKLFPKGRLWKSGLVELGGNRISVTINVQFCGGNGDVPALPPVAAPGAEVGRQIERSAANGRPVTFRPAREASGGDFLALRGIPRLLRD